MKNTNQVVAPPTTKGSRHLNQGNAPGRLSAYSLLCECQRLLMDEMRSSAGKPVARAQVARAIKEIEAQKAWRRLRIFHFAGAKTAGHGGEKECSDCFRCDFHTFLNG